MTRAALYETHARPQRDAQPSFRPILYVDIARSPGFPRGCAFNYTTELVQMAQAATAYQVACVFSVSEAADTSRETTTCFVLHGGSPVKRYHRQKINTVQKGVGGGKRNEAF